MNFEWLKQSIVIGAFREHMIEMTLIADFILYYCDERIIHCLVALCAARIVAFG